MPNWCERSEGNGLTASSWQKATVTPIITSSNQATQKSVSARNTKVHFENRRRKNVSGTDKSQSLLQHLDGWVTFWCEQHESSTDYLNSKTNILCFLMQQKKQFRYTKTNKSGRNGDLNVFECGMCLVRNSMSCSGCCSVRRIFLWAP